ncbi:MAG: hypothetical protein ACXWCZ_04520 [Flavisolibacter sp.]
MIDQVFSIVFTKHLYLQQNKIYFYQSLCSIGGGFLPSLSIFLCFSKHVYVLNKAKNKMGIGMKSDVKDFILFIRLFRSFVA